MQGELFQPATLVVRNALIGDDGTAPLFVIGCGREKLSEAAPAHQLYTSDRFRSSVSIAHQLSGRFVILSGKYGIVDPDQILRPYDMDLTNLSAAEQRAWAVEAVERLAQQAAGRTISLLVTKTYSLPLIEANSLRSKPLNMIFPWHTLEAPDERVWISEARKMATRIHELDRLYDWINQKRQAKQVFSFAALSTREVPKRGVYIFLDPTEPNFRANGSRVVRIGTHAVSAGSQALLRSRLRNHLGPANEVGNHRGSIFRLHVGRAMLELDGGHARLPSWGEGQDAASEIRALEQALELAVSRYMQKLEVILIEIDDEPSKDSLRAHAEAQLIALFSDAMQTIDLPTSGWLGSNSPVELIRLSGLWNIRGVGATYDPVGVGSITNLVEA